MKTLNMRHKGRVLQIPVVTTAERDSLAAEDGFVLLNKDALNPQGDTGCLEYFIAGEWRCLGSGTTGALGFTGIIGGTQGATGTQGETGAYPHAEEYNVNLSSGVVHGGELSINAEDDTKYDVAPGHAVISDSWTDPDNPQVHILKWEGMTGVSVTGLSNQDVTYVSIDKNYNLVETPSRPSNSQRRDYVWLGRVVHRNRVNIDKTTTQPDISAAPVSQLRDLMAAVGFVNLKGNRILPHNGDLQVSKSHGYLFGSGVNAENDLKDPHTKEVPAVDPLPFQYLTQAQGSEEPETTFISPGFYDVGGVKTAVPNNKFTNQRFYLFSGGNIQVQYGQQVYNQLSDAVLGVEQETFNHEKNVEENSVLISVLIVKEGATDLSDPTQAKFVYVSKFGEVIAGAGASVSTTLQRAYNNSVDPEIITDEGRGALTIQKGSGATGSTLLELRDFSGKTQASFNEFGEGRFNLVMGSTGEVPISKKVLTYDPAVQTMVWEESITGIQGETGAQGYPGPTGLEGPQGATGVGYVGSDGGTGAQGETGMQGVTGMPGSNVIWYHSAMMGSAASNIGMFSIHPQNSNPFNNSITNPYDAYNNGYLNPLKFPWDWEVKEVYGTVGKCAVGVGTVGSNPTIRIDFYSHSGYSRTFLASVDLPLTGSCGVWNNLGGNNYQNLSLTGITGLQGSAGDNVGWQFTNRGSTSDEVNAVSMMNILVKVEKR